MQYVLSEDEYKAMVSKDEVVLRDHALAAAREKLLALANRECIHTEGGRNFAGYCDDCPCSPIGRGNDYRTWSRVCWLHKNYSK